MFSQLVFAFHICSYEKFRDRAIFRRAGQRLQQCDQDSASSKLFFLLSISSFFPIITASVWPLLSPSHSWLISFQNSNPGTKELFSSRGCRSILGKEADWLSVTVVRGMGFPLTKISLEPRTVFWACRREEGGERGEIYSNGQ